MEVLETKESQQVLPELHTKVLSAIPEGREKSIPISYLMEKLAISQTDSRKINNVINDLIFNYGYPIGTSSEQQSKGIFFIDNEDDLRLACHTLNSRAMGALRRHKRIIENFNNNDQLEADI